MSTPAGWYDDGSGRQRWWDGVQWTDQYAPGSDAGTRGASPMATPYVSAQFEAPRYAAPRYAAPQYAAPGYGPALTPVAPRQPPTLGFVGLGLAALGTALACTPILVTFVLGALVLIAAFVVSLVAVFRKNSAKWPSIVGICLSIIGGIVGAVVFTVVLLVTLTTAIIESVPSAFPTSAVSEEPSTDTGVGRPSPEEIGRGVQTIFHDRGDTSQDGDPEFFPCMGQFFYDSDLSDRALQTMAEAGDITGPERERAEELTRAGKVACGGQQ